MAFNQGSSVVTGVAWKQVAVAAVNFGVGDLTTAIKGGTWV